MSFILNTAKYRDFNNVPKLRREQLKRNYKPNPAYIKRIAAKASIPLEIQKTNDDMIVEARLKYIEENEVRFFIGYHTDGAIEHCAVFKIKTQV